jgi:hypothetical protein
MKIVLDKDSLQNFHMTKHSKINKFLSYSKLPPGYLKSLENKNVLSNKIYTAIKNLAKA